MSRTKPKITQTVCSWFGFTTLSKGGKEPIQSNPVGTRSTKFSFKISPVSVGRSGFERVVLVWRWCSLVFEKNMTVQYSTYSKWFVASDIDSVYHSVAGQLVQTSRWYFVAFVHLLCPVWQRFLEALGKGWKPLGTFPHIYSVGSWGLPPFQHPQHLDILGYILIPLVDSSKTCGHSGCPKKLFSWGCGNSVSFCTPKTRTPRFFGRAFCTMLLNNLDCFVLFEFAKQLQGF